VPGGPPGLQNRWTARRAVGGFDSRPPPPGPGAAVIWFLSRRCPGRGARLRLSSAGIHMSAPTRPGAVALNRLLRSHPLRHLRRALAARKRTVHPWHEGKTVEVFGRHRARRAPLTHSCGGDPQETRYVRFAPRARTGETDAWAHNCDPCHRLPMTHGMPGSGRPAPWAGTQSTCAPNGHMLRGAMNQPVRDDMQAFAYTPSRDCPGQRPGTVA
jgi:hypothetical protein